MARSKRKSGRRRSSPAAKRASSQKRMMKFLQPAALGAVAGGYLEGSTETVIDVPFLGPMELDELVGAGALLYGYSSGQESVAYFGFGMASAKLHELGFNVATRGLGSMVQDVRDQIASG